MRTLEEIRTGLAKVRIPVVAAETGLHVNTVYNVVNKRGEPTYDTLRRLDAWLNQLGGKTCK